MYKKLLVGIVLMLGCLGLLVTSCGPAGPGEKCETDPDCVGGYSCVKGTCKTKTIIVYPDAPPAQEPKAGEEPSTGAEGNAGTEASLESTSGTESTGAEPTAGPESAGPEPTTDAATGPEQGTGPESTTGPEQPPQDTPPASALSLYEMNDPNLGKQPKNNDPVATTPVVVTTVAVRLSNTLNAFFVQEEKQRNGSFQYGGMMVVYERTKYPTLQASLGTLYKLQGTFLDYRSVDWQSTCTSDADCSTQTERTACKEVYDNQTQQTSKKCVSGVGMPQIQLTAAPTWAGNTQPPAPTVVKTSDVRNGGSLAIPYRSVLLEVKNVTVTNANPDEPRDYGEFSVSDSGSSNDLRVDDMINTILYTGSKFCFGCSSKPVQPDDSYCLPGDTCNCKGSDGRCYSGNATSDQRSKGDTFRSVVGVLRYANGHFKLNPRLPTDLQK
ncbi:MAG: hypothetical protein EP343_13480 [Deltaproteobacteria bacterium]|nr:MAG: hypothetical protein EP343_13480 [Deltaproteobacteria bacterium]